MSSSHNDLSSVVVAATTQLLIAAGCIAGFSFLRPANKAVYEPKLKYAHEHKKPKNIDSTPWAWLDPIRTVDETELLNKVGLDGVLFLRFVIMGAKYFGFMSVFSVPFMVINYYAPQIDNPGQTLAKSSNTTVFDLALSTLTIQNISLKGSKLFYIPAFLAYLSTFVLMYLLYDSWQHFIVLREWYFNSDDYLHSHHNRMLLVTDNPVELRTVPKMKSYLQKQGLTKVPEQIQIGRDYQALSSKIAQHLKTTKAFEKCLATYLKDPFNLPPKRPHHYINGLFGVLGGERVDSIDYYCAELKALEKEIYSLRAKPESEFDADSSCFLGFRDIREAHEAAKELSNPLGQHPVLHALLNKAHVKMSPHFDDILWENIGVAPPLKKTRALIANGILAALILGWVAIQAFIGGLANSLLPITNSKAVSTPFVIFCLAFVAPLLLSLLNSLLPTFLRLIARLQGVYSESGVERSSLYKYYVFQIYQLLTQIATSFIVPYFYSILKGESPSLDSLLKSISTSFVSKSSYFIPFICAGYSSYGLEIIQGYPLIRNYIRRRFFVFTPRDELEAIETPKFDYLATYGFLLLVMLLAMAYSCIAPLIIPFAALIFFLAYLTFKYQLLYIYETKHESGGKWFDNIFHLVVVSMIIFQLTTFGALVVIGVQTVAVVGQDDGKLPNILVIVLPFLTLLFWAYIIYFVKPKSDYVTDNVNVEMARYELDYRFQSDVMKDRLFNPAIVKLLPKVWVRKAQVPLADGLYRPDYRDVVDFVEKTNPAQASSVAKQEHERDAVRDTLERKRRSNLVVSEVDMAMPPEIQDVYGGHTIPARGDSTGPHLYTRSVDSSRTRYHGNAH
ncbi:hypothetical protein HDV03_003148 [Kappamyces sp. JEL0829]|nr:hypothetical protein HDV03_003148 [Kappamyces sp. JEL0829]